MTILTEIELSRMKQEARRREIRQNVKSHCTKIRDGIRKNGSTSGNRAIWELFQNAGDLADCAEIKIILTDNAFVFAHKGKPFTYDSLCSLVKQVSSEEKEGDDTVGQYGTGFLTTHTFSRKITVNGSMQISDDPIVYVDLNDFLINRENFDDIPLFINDMTEQIENVEKLMDTEQKYTQSEWTELSYELNEERKKKVQTAIDEAVKLMPFVLTFNDNIGSCTIEDKTRMKCATFSKEKLLTGIDELLCTRVWKTENSGVRQPIDCYYLRLHGGDSKIILPLKTATDVCSLDGVPRLFVHFPLIGSDYFNVNFIFHSHRFTPEEPRDNIIVPRDNDATDQIATANKQVLNEMTTCLWEYLETYIHTWHNTIEMASVNIKDNGYAETKTEVYYKALKDCWVAEFSKLRMIEIGDNRYSMSETGHPVVLEPTLEAFLTGDEEHDYLSTLYDYAKDVALIPCKEELLHWSQIIAGWDAITVENFITLEDIVQFVCKNQGEHLLEMLNMIVDAGHTDFFERYTLLPNREKVLMTRGDLRDARSITPDLYRLVKAFDERICTQMVHTEFADIVELTAYNRQNLREELNSVVKEKEHECWEDPDNPHAYDGSFEKCLIDLCSSFTTQNGESKRNKLMPIICRFEGLEYEEKYIPAWKDDPSSFDLYRQIFTSLVENQMMKIDQKDNAWVAEHINDLVGFVDNARGDDYKSFCVRYAIYPDMNGYLHTPGDLRKNVKVNDKLFDLFHQVMGEDLKSKCVDKRFELFYDKYSEEIFCYTPYSVANEIQNKLSAGNYQDTVLLDIIDLTEQSGGEGQQWKLLFKDIYEQRESIRYKLGTDDERRAINRMMKRKSPQLLEMMADVVERKDADKLISALNDTINNMEREEHVKLLGEFVERHIEGFLIDALSTIGVTVSNEQGGQDLILRKEGYEDYFVEIKSRWVDKASAIMSQTQFRNAVANPNRYALISAQMWTFDEERVKANEHIELTEMESRIKVCDRIGKLETELLERIDNAFKYDEGKISAVGSYEVHIPQKTFDMTFDEFVVVLRQIFG